MNSYSQVRKPWVTSWWIWLSIWVPELKVFLCTEVSKMANTVSSYKELQKTSKTVKTCVLPSLEEQAAWGLRLMLWSCAYWAFARFWLNKCPKRLFHFGACPPGVAADRVVARHGLVSLAGTLLQSWVVCPALLFLPVCCPRPHCGLCAEQGAKTPRCVNRWHGSFVTLPHVFLCLWSALRWSTPFMF